MTAETPAKPVLTGGCQCGAVRFAVSAAPNRVSICHCRMCQKASGAPFASFADIDKNDFTWTKGTPAAFQSSTIAMRDFCSACGTQPFSQGTGRDGSPMAMINLRCVSEVDLEAIEKIPFDGASL